MYFSITRKASILLAAVLLLCGRSHAGTIAFLGGETGDLSECTDQTFTTAGTTAVDSAEVNSGGYSYKLASSGTGPVLGCDIGLGNGSPTAIIEGYLRVDTIPTTIAVKTVELLRLDAQPLNSGTHIGVVYLTATAGVPSVQLYNATSAVSVGTTAITTGANYRLVLILTASAGSPVLKLLTCTVPGNSCTTLSDTTDSTGTSNPSTAYFMNYDESGAINGAAGALTLHWDDILITTGSVADPGPEEVLARQFGAAGTYTGWTAFDGTGCPANWNQTPFGTGRSCFSTTAGASTCSGGASACQTGVTHFDSTTGQGSTGFGSQTISSSQTLNAVKIAVWGTMASADATTDSAVFVDSTGAETDTALAAWTASTNTYQEVYLASVPSAFHLIGAQAGLKHSSSTVQHSGYAVWLMADVNTTPSATAVKGGVIIP